MFKTSVCYQEYVKDLKTQEINHNNFFYLEKFPVQ